MAQQSHEESTHSHNPPAEDGVLDYSFRRGGCAYYVPDGRGQRDIGRESFWILGHEQFDRFAAWIDGFWEPAFCYSRRDPCDVSSPGKATTGQVQSVAFHPSLRLNSEVALI